MRPILFLLLAVVGLSAATEKGKVVAVGADGWAKVSPDQTEGAVLLRRFSEGDRKVGWTCRLVRYEAVTE